MIYVYRLLWLIGYIPVFLLELVMFIVLMFTYPIVGAFYFIKTGDVENTPYHFFAPVMYVDEKYKNMFIKTEDKHGNRDKQTKVEE